MTSVDRAAADHYRSEMVFYADCLSHVLAIGGVLHRDGTCRTCDWIRVRPVPAYGSLAEAEAAHAELVKPRVPWATP